MAVIISADELKSIGTLKLQLLQSRTAKANDDIQAGHLVNGESFFDALESEHHD